MPESPRAVVFVHGAGGGGWEWAVWARVFAAEGYTVSAPDLRPGPGGLAATTLAEYAAQVGDWLAAATAVGGPPPVLAGASLGGLLALMQGAATGPRVLVNPMPPAGLPGEASPPVVPWGRRASLAGTRRAIPEADDFAALSAFRRWRDESGRVLDQARAGVAVPRLPGPVLVMASDADTDVPPAISATLAADLGADLLHWPGSHVAPLLGAGAADAARLAVEWLNGPGRRR